MAPSLRIVQVGTGGIARLRHIPAFQKAEGLGLAQLIALADPVEASVRSAAAEFGVPEAVTDWRKVVARDDVDLVSVATPNAYHEEISVAALQAGKHVLCEKPLALDLAGARRMLRVADASGKRTSVNFRYRWVPSMRFLHQLVEQGELGEIRHVFMNYLNSGRVDPDRPVSWRQMRAEAGSGNLGDLGSHMIDLAHWLVGPIGRVSARLTTFTKERPSTDGGRIAVDVDDTASCIFEFENGATGTLTASGAAPGRSNYQRIEIYGTKGGAVYEIDKTGDVGGNVLQLCLGPSQSRVGGWAAVPVPRPHDASNPLEPFLDFVRAIHAGKDAPVTFADAVRAQEVIEAAELSDRENRWIDLPIS
jgi:predicted dehydrogenase